MAAESQFRCDVAGPEALAELLEAALPSRLRGSPPARSFHRDIYLDTADQTLLNKGVSCRVRLQTDDRRLLTLFISGGTSLRGERYEAEVPELDPRQALEGNSEPARRLRGLVDPLSLKPSIELEVERWSRIASAGFFHREPRFAFLYDLCTIRHGGLTRTFEELQVRRLAPGAPHLDEIARMLEQEHGLRPLVIPRHQRAAQLVVSMSAEVAERRFSTETAVVLLALDEGRVGFVEHEGGHALPVARGSGEEAARHLLRRVTGSTVGTLSLLGSLPGTEDRDALEVWVARRIRGDGDGDNQLQWVSASEAVARIGTPEIRTAETLAALAVATRANLLASPGRGPTERFAPPPPPKHRATAAAAHRAAPPRASTELPPDRFLNAELSQLAFNERVLEMAEDPGVPLAERLRFLAIVGSNFDELFSVRVGALKAAVLAGSSARGFDGLTPREQLEAISARVPPLLARQTRCSEECLAAAAGTGMRLRRWDDLDDAARAALTRHFEAEMLPVLTPRAMTLSPGHPFPVIPQLTLTFGVVLLDVRTGPVHFATLPLRARLERILTVPGGEDLILVEEVIRANIQAFYPDRIVEGAWLFRITRAADLEVNEEEAGDLLQAIEEEVKRRPGNAPVRVEVEASMPPGVRETILRELRFERRGVTALLGPEDLYELDPPLDLTVMRDLAARLPADQSFRPFHPRRPLAPDRSVFDQIDQGDILVHHPYEEFAATVGRFLHEAAEDPGVLALKLTLYRLGEHSLVVDALVRAAEKGKDVAVFIELKARFDETRNVRSVRRLEDAGAQVIYGLVGLKTHAKVSLVVRRTAEGLRRYAHIGTGNYNESTARYYTDLGLLTSDPEITADLTDLFNQLTGSSRAPGSSYRRLLVAPATMLPGFLERIEREIGHARAGRGGLIRAQLNGIEDPEVVAALYRAGAAGVEVRLVVRGLCILRPGVGGVSERIQVSSVLGRFLEHERIYHFGNGGEEEYLIGSADWRPRNLRRRVEVVTPVRAPTLVARLDALLSALLAEPSAWILGPDGTYVRRGRPGPEHPHLHERLLP
jgi:polyphosphate kinase